MKSKNMDFTIFSKYGKEKYGNITTSVTKSQTCQH